jgi:CO/xanthine dehydrogenase FAD-binding subunit
LVGAEASAELFAHAADVALANAEPLEHNAYKLPLAKVLILVTEQTSPND